MDQPTIDGVNVYFVAREAHDLGLKVALSGLGGDELFGGYDTFRQVPNLVGALGGIPGLNHLGRALRAVSSPLAKRLTSPKWAGLLEYGTRPGDAYLLRRGLFMPWELPGVLGPDLARAGWKALEPLLRLEQCHAPVAEPRRKVAALEMAWYMRNQLLRDADWAGMAHSLEIRVPFVDETLLRALAPSLGRPGGPGKLDMAQTPATALPKSVLNRPKTGFFVPVSDWLQGDRSGAERGLRGWARRVYGAAL
jgi:asparagine synthase (glutamine-hydrolysing)